MSGLLARTLGRGCRLVSLLRYSSCSEPTIQDVWRQLEEYGGVSGSYRPKREDRSHLLELHPKSQDELPGRKVQDSFGTAVIPLACDDVLRDKYVTFRGTTRMGRLLEDMDLFAAWIAHRHMKLPALKVDKPRPYVVVTLLVDHVDFTDYVPTIDADIRLSGHVSWVGKSSLEVKVWLEQEAGSGRHKINSSLFVLALRNATNNGPAVVNPLLADSDQEKKMVQHAEERKKERMAQQEGTVYRQLPDVSEQGLLHDLFRDTIETKDVLYLHRHLPPDSLWMMDYRLHNVILCHPQDRNTYHQVFGGFLMRQAMELSWATGYMYSKVLPDLCHLSDSGFHKPVDIGSLLRLKSYVTYTEQSYMQILVHAEVFNPRGDYMTTNKFHHTYRIDQNVPRVFPRTYQEAMLYLDGRRHFLHATAKERKKTDKGLVPASPLMGGTP